MTIQEQLLFAIHPHGISYNSLSAYVSYTSPVVLPAVVVSTTPDFRVPVHVFLLLKPFSNSVFHWNLILTLTITPLNLQLMTTVRGCVTEVVRMWVGDRTFEKGLSTDAGEVPVSRGECEDCCPYDDCVVHRGGICSSVGRLWGEGREGAVRPF